MYNTTNNEGKDDCRMSFDTVSSMMVFNDDKTIKLKDDFEDSDNNGGFNTINMISNYDPNNNSSSKGCNKNNSEPKDNFEDLPLLHCQNPKKNIVSFLTVEDKGDKKELLIAFRNYEISVTSEKNEKRILCYRRYDNFDIFYNKLKRKYPYLLIPKLIGKSPLNKIMNVEEEFYSKRRRQLNFFLNYLHTHEKLKDSREFIKFINDPDFDTEYFKREDNLYYFPESSKSADTLKNKIYGVFSNFSEYFKGSSVEIPSPSENEEKLKLMDDFYKKKLTLFKEIKNNLAEYISNIKKSSDNYGSLSNNFFYLKDVAFDAQNTKEYFFKFSELALELEKLNKKYFEGDGVNIDDKFECFLSVLTGLCDMFDRYTEFLKINYVVLKAKTDFKLHPNDYDQHRLNQEVESVNQLKSAFEKNLLDETNTFIQKNSNVYVDILETYKQLIKSINNMEFTQMNLYSNYFK